MSALIYCPFPDAVRAERVGAQLLDEGLIACINIGAPVRSLFIWHGERGEGDEIPALLKTDASLLERAVARLADLHPYDCPAIMGWRCDAVGSATQRWLSDFAGAGRHCERPI